MTRGRANENRLKKAIAHLRRPRRPVTDATPPGPRITTHLPPEQRLAAAIIFQAFKDASRGPQCRQAEALEWLRSDTAALWLSVLKLPPENLDRALKNFPEHRYRSNVHFDPAAARKAYQTRLKRGNWMKPSKSWRPSTIGASPEPLFRLLALCPVAGAHYPAFRLRVRRLT